MAPLVQSATTPSDGHAIVTVRVDLDVDTDRALQMGAEAHRRVCEEYLAPRRLTREMELINRVAS